MTCCRSSYHVLPLTEAVVFRYADPFRFQTQVRHSVELAFDLVSLYRSSLSEQVLGVASYFWLLEDRPLQAAPP